MHAPAQAKSEEIAGRGAGMSLNGDILPPPRSAWVLKIINPLRISSPECFTGQRRPIAPSRLFGDI
jgi:hypothetical protein